MHKCIIVAKSDEDLLALDTAFLIGMASLPWDSPEAASPQKNVHEIVDL